MSDPPGQAEMARLVNGVAGFCFCYHAGVVNNNPPSLFRPATMVRSRLLPRSAPDFDAMTESESGVTIFIDTLCIHVSNEGNV